MRNDMSKRIITCFANGALFWVVFMWPWAATLFFFCAVNAAPLFTREWQLKPVKRTSRRLR